VLPIVLVPLGVPFEVVRFFSPLPVVALFGGFVLLVVAASRWDRWSFVLAWLALAAETGAALLLLVHEERPAYLHPEWDWYWPVVNTLYFGGLLPCIAALVSSTLAVVRTRRRGSAVAFLVAAAALVVNRIAQYR
jgi:hypothetical protein